MLGIRNARCSKISQILNELLFCIFERRAIRAALLWGGHDSLLFILIFLSGEISPCDTPQPRCPIGNGLVWPSWPVANKIEGFERSIGLIYCGNYYWSGESTHDLDAFLKGSRNVKYICEVVKLLIYEVFFWENEICFENDFKRLNISVEALNLNWLCTNNYSWKPLPTNFFVLKIGIIKLKWPQFPRSVRSKFINLINCRRKQPGSLKLRSAGPTFNYGTHIIMFDAIALIICETGNFSHTHTFSLSPSHSVQTQYSDQLHNPQNAIKQNFGGSSLSVELFKVATSIIGMIFLCMCINCPQRTKNSTTIFS